MRVMTSLLGELIFKSRVKRTTRKLENQTTMHRELMIRVATHRTTKKSHTFH